MTSSTIHRQAVFTGTERRTGFERRAVAPRETASGPRLIGSVAVGHTTYGPGQEKQFHDAVSAYNESARAANQPEVDFAVLESKGYLT
ncbi:MAG: hypothetical protein ABIQ32_01150, partial [Sphingomicrobium sp.]